MALVPGRRRSRQAGLTLIESLVAFAVVSLGTVSVIRLQRDLRVGAELSSQRVEAARLGQSELERRRAAAGLAAPEPALAASSVAARSARYVVQADAQALATASPATQTRLQVAWADTTGSARRVDLDTVVAATHPALSAALSLRPIDAGAAPLAGRSPAIPGAAVDIGDGRSAWRLGTGDRATWLFDNATGQVVARCNPPQGAPVTIGSAAGSDCIAAKGLLLEGLVRTSLAAPPDPSHADDSPEPLAVLLALKVPAQANPPPCSAEAQRSVLATLVSGEGLAKRRLGVPLTATPASVGARSWVDLGERFVAYRCLVPDPPGGWSGRTTVVPVDPRVADPSFGPLPAARAWTEGDTARDRRVCRYVTASAAEAGADANARHPADYEKVTRALTRQNFLIVRGDATCPDLSHTGGPKTEPHQPRPATENVGRPGAT